MLFIGAQLVGWCVIVSFELYFAQYYLNIRHSIEFKCKNADVLLRKMVRCCMFFCVVRSEVQPLSLL